MTTGTIDRFVNNNMMFTALIWKLGSNSDEDIIALTPITPAVERWLNNDLDFAQMPPTVAWIAARYVSRAGPLFSFAEFSKLDPDDEGWINISIQQVTSVTNWMPDAMSSGYLDTLPDHLRERVR